MSKDIYCAVCEDLESELGREPTDEEAWQAYQNYIEGLADNYPDERT